MPVVAETPLFWLVWLPQLADRALPVLLAWVVLALVLAAAALLARTAPPDVTAAEPQTQPIPTHAPRGTS